MCSTERLYSYRHLDTYPLLVVVALSKEEIFSTWKAQAYHLTSITTFLLLRAKKQLEKLNSDPDNLVFLDGLACLLNRRKFGTSLVL